jgi:pimeloyl-ACP methyl ester carboxylesterase
MARVRRAAVRNIEVEYEEAGSGDRPFVLVHGFTGSRDDWLEQIPRLAELGRTVAIDQRGHGGSSNTGRPADYTLDNLADDLDAALTTIGIERCDLLGHSMGGMVVLRFALAHPERVSSLILMDTAARPVDVLPRRVIETSSALVRSAGMEALAQIIQDNADKDPNRPPAARRCEREMGQGVFWGRIRAKLDNMDPEAFATLGLALREHEGVVDRLGEIGCPTLVIVGEEDVAFHEPSRELEEGIPRARRVTIADAAHSPQLENADSWFESVRQHLARVRE